MRSSSPNFPPRLVVAFCVALGCGSGCSSSAGVEGYEVFGGELEFCATAGGFGNFLAEAHVVEAGFNIEDADALRVELAGPDGADFFPRDYPPL